VAIASLVSLFRHLGDCTTYGGTDSTATILDIVCIFSFCCFLDSAAGPATAQATNARYGCYRFFPRNCLI